MPSDTALEKELDFESWQMEEIGANDADEEKVWKSEFGWWESRGTRPIGENVPSRDSYTCNQQEFLKSYSRKTRSDSKLRRSYNGKIRVFPNAITFMRFRSWSPLWQFYRYLPHVAHVRVQSKSCIVRDLSCWKGCVDGPKYSAGKLSDVQMFTLTISPAPTSSESFVFHNIDIIYVQFKMPLLCLDRYDPANSRGPPSTHTRSKESKFSKTSNT